MKKLFISGLLLMSVFSLAQITISPSSSVEQTSKWTYGGYAGVSGALGGNDYNGISIYISPRGGYKITEDFEVGVSANLSWANSKYYTSTMVGIGPYANYYFKRRFYIAGLFQEYFINQKIKRSNIKNNFTESALYIGGGYMQPLGGRTYMQIGGMYNILYKNDRSVFGGSFIPNVGIVVGL